MRVKFRPGQKYLYKLCLRKYLLIVPQRLHNIKIMFDTDKTNIYFQTNFHIIIPFNFNIKKQQQKNTKN